MSDHLKTNKITKNLAGLLLIIMLALAFFSMRGDSATMDELAHIPAGYSYIIQKDMRLNPEHPPLIKDLSGIFVWLGSKITDKPIAFPDQAKSWREDINGQWEFGRDLLYRSGNDADSIIFWARLPILLIMLILGFYIFKWASELYGNKAGLLALFLYAFSPEFIAHGHYVTTDVGAAAAFFIATYYLIKWLNQQNKKNLIVAGLVFGLALLTKFSTVILVPYFAFLAAVWIFILLFQKSLPNDSKMLTYSSSWQASLKLLASFLLIGLIGVALIWPVYQFHTWNYPAARQFNDAKFTLQSFGNRLLADPIVRMSNVSILRPYAQYFLGVLMVTQRSAGGNTTYFLGEIANSGWHNYFPIVFLIKVPLALILLMLIALIYCFRQIKPHSEYGLPKRILVWIKKHFTEFALLSFFALYWLLSINSTLNIGVRHVLPTFPIIYVLISGAITRWTKITFAPVFDNIKFSLLNIIKILEATIGVLFSVYLKHVLLALLLLWYAFGTVRAYPYFLSYFNESIGGSQNGYKYVVDSNLDWGQDLKRLTQWVDNYNQCARIKGNPSSHFGCPSMCYNISNPAPEINAPIDKLYIDYFGGGEPAYYLKEKFQPWWGNRNPAELPSNGWLAVSATFLQGGRGYAPAGFGQLTGFYRWLDNYSPVATIGNSIFIYHIF